MKMTAIIIAIFILIFPLIFKDSYAVKAPMKIIYPNYRVTDKRIYKLKDAVTRIEISEDGFYYTVKDVSDFITEADILNNAVIVKTSAAHYTDIRNHVDEVMRVGGRPRQIHPIP